VIEGELQEFTLEYPCHSPVEQRWFVIRITRIEHLGQIRVLVTHEDITPWKLNQLLLASHTKPSPDAETQLDNSNHPQFVNLVKILLIENDLDNACQLAGNLAGETQIINFDITYFQRVEVALKQMGQTSFDIILLALGGLDMLPAEAVFRLHNQAPSTPLIVLAPPQDSSTAISLRQLGAHDHLVIGTFDMNQLARSIYYVIEQHRLMTELQQNQLSEWRDQELQSLEHLSAFTKTHLTAQMFGAGPLQEIAPAAFAELTKNYSDLLDLALRQRVYKEEHNLSAKLRQIAYRLGFLKAGPRDVIDIYTLTLKQILADLPPAKTQVYIEEGRLMVLELMGYLVSYYRSSAVGYFSDY
jgi:DNA-binding response OmpR family regulator